MNDLEFFAANLFSKDCARSAEIYSQVFGFKITHSEKNHSEIQSEQGFRIIFSKESENCKVCPGSVTFSCDHIEKDYFLKFFILETESEKYASFLDEFENRIWIYQVKKERV